MKDRRITIPQCTSMPNKLSSIFKVPLCHHFYLWYNCMEIFTYDARMKENSKVSVSDKATLTTLH